MLVLSCSIDTGALKKLPNWLLVNRGFAFWKIDGIVASFKTRGLLLVFKPGHKCESLERWMLES